MEESRSTTYKATVTKGYLGDFATEWWTDEDHAKWAKHVQELKDTGEFGKKEEVEITLNHNPLYDNRNYGQLESSSMGFLDFGKTEFHGINYTLQDGSTEFALAHPEVKEEVQR